MASLLKRKSEKTGKTLWTVQVSLDKQGRRRPTIPLRNLTKMQATTAKGYIESLASSNALAFRWTGQLQIGSPASGAIYGGDWLRWGCANHRSKLSRSRNHWKPR